MAIVLAGFVPHPLHVSVTEIEMKEEPREMQITMRIFIDDIEAAIRKERNEPELDITKPTGGLSTDELIKTYLAPRFALELDGKTSTVKYLGNETQGDVFYLYLLVSDVPQWKSITVHNTIIMDVYDDQSNIVNVSVKDEVRSLRLTAGEQSGKLEF